MERTLLAANNFTSSERSILTRAVRLLEKKLRAEIIVLNSPQLVRQWLALKFAGLDREVFAGIFLDAQNRLLAFEVLSTGTLTQASVYPREVVKVALARNAAAVMFVHNHPSGCAEPSRADELLTQSLKQALSTVDIKV